jgi:hypothetical protein
MGIGYLNIWRGRGLKLIKLIKSIKLIRRDIDWQFRLILNRVKTEERKV